MKKVLLTSSAVILLLTMADLHATTYALETSVSSGESTQSTPNLSAETGENDKNVLDHFIDISGHWAESSILNAIKQGIVSGYPDGMFYPDNQVTRAEFLKLIAGSFGTEIDSIPSHGLWYEVYVKSAKLKGLYSESDFPVDDWTKPMSRLEMIHVAVRAIDQKASTDKEFMYIAVKNGLISGTGIGKLDPEGTTTRAQALIILERIQKIRNGETLKVDEVALAKAEQAMNATTDYWGHVIRTTNLPKNAKDYPYILEEYPNEMYEMKPYQAIDTTSIELSKTDLAYNSKPILDMWKNNVEGYYEKILNVDYRTIDDTWATRAFSYANRGNLGMLPAMKRYVTYVKQNKVIITGNVVAEPSMAMQSKRYGEYYIRIKFEFTLKSFNKDSNVIFDPFMGDHPIHFIKGTRYEGYADIPLATTTGDYDLKVGGITSLFNFGSIIRPSK
ncbi:S-layer homology domain-containing protein [Paenibacillus xylanexedens]|uniref:S-layer homology domain-containing protein n=1 Tax=Paenibacillus xylanexedens TaxID=528191 RepID=UPI001C8EE266|nr:S-layer homology domain-containing protein [Paenibacillus xylanexedens]MBY0115275.1 S-layer homology domain-containing protein [Paenibacillus xylanexedens]